jgi:GNAT superfamily N-acetyltransferase
MYGETEREIAHGLIGLIDIGEAHLFLEHIDNQDKCVMYQFFRFNDITGVFLSFIYRGILRIHISFSVDTNQYVDKIAELIKKSIDKTKIEKVFIWLRNENKQLIADLQTRIKFNPDGINNSHYASVEYIMKRDKFIKIQNDFLLIHDYKNEHINGYLKLLDESMDFIKPRPAFLINKDYYQSKFIECNKEKSFESFWLKTELIGLYWRKECEIDIMAVSKQHYRKGFGSIILSRAIECGFNNTNKPFVYLYCVDWNENGRKFYNKFGMEIKGHSYVLSIN